MPRRGRLVSFDLNYRPALWVTRSEDASEVLARLARHSDIVFLGADEASAVFGTDDPARLRALFPEPEHLIVKNDAHTVTGFHRDERVDVPALRLDVVEKIGAGDAFAGGFLAGLLHGLGHEERIRLGHLCAAAALTGHGDIAELPPRARLEELAALDSAEWARLDYAASIRTGASRMSQSLSRALTILGELGEDAKSLEQLATHLDVHKSTVLRLLRTLESERFVRHDTGHRYVLGSRLFELANRALEQRDVRTVARPHLGRLNSSTGQTIHLATYESGEAVYIDKFDAIQSVRMYSRVGRPAPLHCTAVGKVLVAGRPRSEWRQIAERIEYVKFTERTIDSPERYLAELELVAAQDFAEDHQEHESFVNCIAVPVRDGTGAVVAAVSMSVPDVLLDHEQVLATLPQVRTAADAISEDLGWFPAA